MKTRILLALAATCGLLPLSASALVVTDVASPTSSCDGGSWNVDFYGNFQGHLWDRYNAAGESYVSASSRIDVFVKGGKVNIPNGWVQTTSYAPAPGQYFVAWNNSLSSLNLANLVPADRGTPVAQVTYAIRRAPRSSGGTTLNGSYYTSPFSGGVPSVTDRGNLGLGFDLSSITMDHECFNIYPRWCGDGVVDPEETCDPEDPTGAGLAPGEICDPNSCRPTIVVSNTSCQNATASSTSLITGGSMVVSCNAVAPNAATQYTIECGNGTTQTGTGNTLNCTYAAAGSYSPRCRVDAETAFSAACTASVTVTGGGGSSAQCQSISLSANSSNVGALTSRITCNSNNPPVANQYVIECGNGQTFTGATNVQTCSYSTGQYSPRCLVNNESAPAAACIGSITVTGQGGGSSSSSSSSSSGGGGGGSSSSGGGGTPGFCGDGILQRPNGSGQNESCDAGTNNGKAGYACTSTCTIGSTNPGGNANEIRMTTTNPGSAGNLSVSSYRAIVGDGVRVFSDSDTLSFFATYPIYISGKDTYVTNASPVISGTDVSRVISESDLCVGPAGSNMKVGSSAVDGSGGIVFNYHDVACRDGYTLWNGNQLATFKGKTAPLASNETYRDTLPGEFYVGIRFLQEDVNVRVAKSVVSNTVGGNAYLARATGYDVNTIANTFLDNLKKGNFTTASIVSGDLGSGRNLSSATATATIPVGTNKAQLGSLETVSSNQYSGNLEVHSEGDFDALPQMGDDERVRVLSNGELEIGSSTSDVSLSKVRTIVVENGTLRITGNMAYANKDASYAFIVKNGRIIVEPGVTKIAGAFLVMRGDIRGNGTKTTNRLSVDGNVYGNAAPLVDERTYVRGTVFSTALTTGVTINYSSRAIKNPPPLLTQFVEQYSLDRVAK
ncbi:MAG: hypothetical protein WA194_02770 [Patescibacteria group bacterium]